MANGNLESAKQNGIRIGRLEKGLEDTVSRLDRRGKSTDDKFSEIFGRLNELPEKIAAAVKDQMEAAKPMIIGAVREEIDLVLNGRHKKHPRLSKYGRPAVLWTAAAVIISEVADFLTPVLERMLE